MNLEFLQTPLGEDPVMVSAVFKASPARLYQAWTDPEELTRWFGRTPNSLKRAEVDLRVGGAWRFSFAEEEGALLGEYVEIVPDERLVFTWRHEKRVESGRIEATPVSQVTVRFEPEGAGARLTVRHEGVLAEEGRRNVGGGWSGCIGHLRALLAEPAETAEARS